MQDLEKARHYLDKYIALKAETLIPPPPNYPYGGPISPVVEPNQKLQHRSDEYFSLEGVQGSRAEYTCRKCRTTFWVGWNDNPHKHHDCPGRAYMSQG